MDHFAGMLTGGSLLPASLQDSCVEMGSSNAAMHRDCDSGLDKDGDHLHETDRHGGLDLDLLPQGEGDVLYEHDDDDDDHAEAAQVRRKKYRGPRSWKDKWQELHPWAFVRTVNGEERMFCTVCEAHGNTSTRNAFKKDGSSNFQPSALSTHANSSAHKNALFMQKAWAEAGKMGIISKGRGKVPVVTEYGAIATHLANITSRLRNVVTRDDLDALKTEWRIMQRCKDARRINSCCALTDPLVPVPTLDGVIPDNLPDSLAELVALPCEHIETLLMAYDLPIHGTLDAKIRRLKAHLGFCH
eukprot:c23548_g1_i1 orf=500-1402(-)